MAFIVITTSFKTLKRPQTKWYTRKDNFLAQFFVPVHGSICSDCFLNHRIEDSHWLSENFKESELELTFATKWVTTTQKGHEKLVQKTTYLHYHFVCGHLSLLKDVYTSCISDLRTIFSLHFLIIHITMYTRFSL